MDTEQQDTSYKDKMASFIEEASLVSGVGIGTIIGLDMAAKNLNYAVQSHMGVLSLLHGATVGVALGIMVSYVGPILANVFNQANNKEFPVEQLFETHHHKPSRLLGLFAGAALTASLGIAHAGIPGQEDPVNIASLKKGINEIVDFFTTNTQPDIIFASLR